MILGGDLLTALVLDLKISEQVIKVGDRLYKDCTAPMLDKCNYEYICLNLKIHLKVEEWFMDAYVQEFLNKNVVGEILDAKYEK